MRVRQTLSKYVTVTAAGLLAVLMLTVLLAAPAQASDRNLASEGTLGLGAAACSLVYAPLKLVYASGGLALSTMVLVWTFGDTQVAGTVFAQTVGGDYVVTPDHLEGRRRLHFFGI